MNISEETIDSFLRGDLTGDELENFNKALSADPKMQQEVSFQQDVVDSIKQYRHNQLKNRLNSIEMAPVSVGSSASTYLKLAASIGIVALLIGAFAILTNTQKEENNTPISDLETQSTESVIVSTPEPAISSNNNSTDQKTIAPKNSNSETKATSKIVDASTANSKTKKSTVATNTNEASVNTSVPGDEEMTSDDMAFDSRSENFSTPTITNTDHSNISASVVKVNIVKEKNLAYRYFNNELYLHGNFSNSTYELFELNNKPSKQLFLYFENNYYELIQGKTKVTALVPITDKATLSQLAQLREH